MSVVIGALAPQSNPTGVSLPGETVDGGLKLEAGREVTLPIVHLFATGADGRNPSDLLEEYTSAQAASSPPGAAAAEGVGRGSNMRGLKRPTRRPGKKA